MVQWLKFWLVFLKFEWKWNNNIVIFNNDVFSNRMTTSYFEGFEDLKIMKWGSHLFKLMRFIK